MSTPPRKPRRSGNPAVRADTPAQSVTRAGLEQRSQPILVRLAAIPRAVVLVGAIAWLMAGLFLPSMIGAALLIALAAALSWLVAVSWPVLATPQRLLRGVTILLVLGYAVARLLGK